MKEEQIIDPTGTPLTPSPQGKDCLGNGDYEEYECCCDECDYFLYCFPQYDPFREPSSSELDNDEEDML